jgi:hypothetical protein
VGAPHGDSGAIGDAAFGAGGFREMTIRADNRLADVPMTPIRCIRCAAEVQVRKSSLNQTSVQWDATALAACTERADVQRLSAYGEAGLFLACSALNESITGAVREGRMPVVDETVSVFT